MVKGREFSGDFYEDDEPEEAIYAALERGIPLITISPILGFTTQTFNLGCAILNSMPLQVSVFSQVVEITDDELLNQGSPRVAHLA